MSKPSPWHPEKDALRLKLLGKLTEEVCELGAALSRCIIQGIDEAEPVTGKVNRQWLQEELADVLANIALVIDGFALDEKMIMERADRKRLYLLDWHRITEEE